MGQIKRTSQIVSTAEGAVLKQLRQGCGFSMREAGQLIRRSDSYISHIETGRLDFPSGDKLQKFLNIYGVVEMGEFQKKVYFYRKSVGKKEKLHNLIEKMSEEKLEILSQLLGFLLKQEKEKLCFPCSKL